MLLNCILWHFKFISKCLNFMQSPKMPYAESTQCCVPISMIYFTHLSLKKYNRSHFQRCDQCCYHPLSSFQLIVYVPKIGHSQWKQCIFCALDIQHLNRIPQRLRNTMKTGPNLIILITWHILSLVTRWSMWLDLKKLHSFHIRTPKLGIVSPFFSHAGHTCA